LTASGIVSRAHLTSTEFRKDRVHANVEWSRRHRQGTSQQNQPTNTEYAPAIPAGLFVTADASERLCVVWSEAMCGGQWTRVLLQTVGTLYAIGLRKGEGVHKCGTNQPPAPRHHRSPAAVDCFPSSCCGLRACLSASATRDERSRPPARLPPPFTRRWHHCVQRADLTNSRLA
jgi:hypothetical protein